MNNSSDAALSEAIDRAAIDYHNEDYERCLRRCSTLMVDNGQSLDERLKRSLYVFMRECCSMLLAHTPSAPPDHQSCSFCGQSPPAVRLGAGPTAFICNECVDTFANVFADAPPLRR